jgi:TPR repeat protein
VDPDSHAWFDPKTGRPNIWHSPGESGALEFFDGPGFHPRTGKALTEITQDFAERLRDDKAWADAEKVGTAAAFTGYVQKFGSGAHVAEARQRLAAIDEERERQKRRCDELAANPNDQNRRRTSRGVSYDELKTHITEAIRACELAVQLLPADLTLQYQLARAVELADPARGQAMQDRLVKLSYPAAFDNAGSLLLNEKGCRQHCINEAVKLFRKGVALGDPDAMMSLADQIGQNHATGDQISLYQRAAKLGHPRAIRALETLAQERMPPRPIFRSPF